jgi:type I restriction enzyme S subunit
MTETPRFVPISDLAEINPRTVLPHHAECSFIGMEDLSEEGQWIGDSTRSSDRAAGYTAFRDDDVLFAKITPCMENGKGALVSGLESGHGIGSTEFHILRARKTTDPRFIAQWAQSRALRAKAAAYMTGSAGQRRVPGSFFEAFRVPYFSLPEQRRIAEILDTADEAIRSTKRLIAKLEQAKQGLFHDLLTHGGRTSPLGVTPGSWPIVHLRDLCVERPRNGLYKPPRFHGSGAPMVQMGQLFRGLSLDASDAPRVQVSASELARFGLARGDLLFGRRSLVLEGAGKCAVVDYVAEPMTFESSLIRVRIDSSRLEPSLAALILSTPEATRDRMRYVRQVAVSGVTSDDVGNFIIPIPPIAEQRRIEEILRTQQSRIEIAREEAAKLRRVKHGLMGDLLIGRVRVGAREDASA